jgi:hypothetical protein
VPPSRVVTLAQGAGDTRIAGPDQPEGDLIALRLTDGGQVVGAVRVRFVADGGLFKADAVLDARCARVEEYENLTRGGDKDFLQNWDRWRIRFGSPSRRYTLRMGFNGTVQARFERSL